MKKGENKDPDQKLTRLFIGQRISKSTEVSLDKEQRHYIRDVLRMGLGDKLILFDGSGYEYAARVSKATATCVKLEVEEKRAGLQESPIQLTSGVGLLKARKMDLVVQKSVELGVQSIYPVTSERAVGSLDVRRGAERRKRWEKIAQEASRQCGRCRIAQINSIATFNEVLQKAGNADVRLLFTARAEKGLFQLERDVPESVKRIFYMTGPEGGFSMEEEQKALEADFIPIRLGPRTLRAETATIVAAGLIQYRFGDMGT